jgi:hypothetical protein
MKVFGLAPERHKKAMFSGTAGCGYSRIAIYNARGPQGIAAGLDQPIDMGTPPDAWWV